MSRFTEGGLAWMSVFPLYNGATGTLVDANQFKAAISLFDFVDGSYLKATNPSMSSDTPTITFNTNRKDATTIRFFKDNTISASANVVTKINEAGGKQSSSTGVDINKKVLVIWGASKSIKGDNDKSVYIELLASVGYFTAASRDWGTTGEQENEYTWTFNCEVATTEEAALIALVQAFEQEEGFGKDTSLADVIGRVDPKDPNSEYILPEYPLKDWDVKHAIQQLLI